MNYIHGHRGSKMTKEYLAWKNMKARVTRKSRSGWKYYGGRGIVCCKEWLESFEAFYRDLGPSPSDIHQIDRINNNGNYEPGNVRWVIPSQNAWNQRRTIVITIDGETKPLKQWYNELNPSVSYNVVRSRITRGWSPVKAFNK